MDIEKMRKWLAITNEYKKTDFWTRVLEEKYPDEMEKKISTNLNLIFIKMNIITSLLWRYRVFIMRSFHFT